MGLEDDLGRIAASAQAHAAGDALVAVLPAEPAPGSRRYLCAYESGDGGRTWLAVDDAGVVVADRADVLAVASITALCEVAEECAFPGDLDELRAQLVALRIAEAPAGIEEAEAAALELQHALGAPPVLATPQRLDAIGTAARRLERALDATAASYFAATMQSAQAVVEELVRDVQEAYRLPFADAGPGPGQVAFDA